MFVAVLYMLGFSRFSRLSSMDGIRRGVRTSHFASCVFAGWWIRWVGHLRSGLLEALYIVSSFRIAMSGSRQPVSIASLIVQLHKFKPSRLTQWPMSDNDSDAIHVDGRESPGLQLPRRKYVWRQEQRPPTSLHETGPSQLVVLVAVRDDSRWLPAFGRRRGRRAASSVGWALDWHEDDPMLLGVCVMAAYKLWFIDEADTYSEAARRLQSLLAGHHTTVRPGFIMSPIFGVAKLLQPKKWQHDGKSSVSALDLFDDEDSMAFKSDMASTPRAGPWKDCIDELRAGTRGAAGRRRW